MADTTVTAPEIQALKDKAKEADSRMFEVIALLHAAINIAEELPENGDDANGLTSPISRLLSILCMGVEKSTAAINALEV